MFQLGLRLANSGFKVAAASFKSKIDPDVTFLERRQSLDTNSRLLLKMGSCFLFTTRR